MIKYLIFLLFFIPSLYSNDIVENNPDEYVLGEGLKIDSLPLYIGGYFSAVYQVGKHETEYKLDDVALLAYGDFEKFSYVTEFEFKELYTLKKTDYDSQSEEDTNIHIERLYIDYNYNENYKLRVGKYNSPIGFWNMLPINVLRATTSNPISTAIIFPQFTTGASFTYSSYEKNELQIDVLFQHNNDLDYTYNNYHIDEHLGLGLTYVLDNFSIKTNVGTFDDQTKNHTSQVLYYGVLALKYEGNTYQVISEFGAQYSRKAVTRPYASYLQGLYHITQEQSLILRIESYKDDVVNEKDTMSVLAYTYRPLLPIALKAEYQLHTLENYNKVLISLSVLF